MTPSCHGSRFTVYGLKTGGENNSCPGLGPVAIYLYGRHLAAALPAPTGPGRSAVPLLSAGPDPPDTGPRLYSQSTPMNSITCTKCGLVAFATAANCKRCGTPYAAAGANEFKQTFGA